VSRKRPRSRRRAEPRPLPSPCWTRRSRWRRLRRRQSHRPPDPRARPAPFGPARSRLGTRPGRRQRLLLHRRRDRRARPLGLFAPVHYLHRLRHRRLPAHRLHDRRAQPPALSPPIHFRPGTPPERLPPLRPHQPRGPRARPPGLFAPVHCHPRLQCRRLPVDRLHDRPARPPAPSPPVRSRPGTPPERLPPPRRRDRRARPPAPFVRVPWALLGHLRWGASPHPPSRHFKRRLTVSRGHRSGNRSHHRGSPFPAPSHSRVWPPRAEPSSPVPPHRLGDLRGPGHPLGRHHFRRWAFGFLPWPHPTRRSLPGRLPRGTPPPRFASGRRF
jgi:hypothetical protein